MNHEFSQVNLDTFKIYFLHQIASFYEKDYTKTEMLTVFLAVLEIIRKQVAVATQDGYDTDIYLEHNDKDDKIQDEGELTNDVEEYN